MKQRVEGSHQHHTGKPTKSNEEAWEKSEGGQGEGRYGLKSVEAQCSLHTPR